jgi:hypothetical protein
MSTVSGPGFMQPQDLTSPRFNNELAAIYALAMAEVQAPRFGLRSNATFDGQPSEHPNR